MKGFPRGRIRKTRSVSAPMSSGSHCMKMIPKIMPYALSMTVMNPKPIGRESVSQQTSTANKATLTCGNAITNHQKEPRGFPTQKDAIMTTKRHSMVSANTAWTTRSTHVRGRSLVA